MKLSEYSEIQLLEEIERRKKIRISMPQRSWELTKRVLMQIYKTVESCLKSAIEKDCWDEDYEAYIFEATMKAFFGKDYFSDFHNKRFT
jgi:hypothetical protein